MVPQGAKTEAPSPPNGNPKKPKRGWSGAGVEVGMLRGRGSMFGQNFGSSQDDPKLLEYVRKPELAMLE